MLQCGHFVRAGTHGPVGAASVETTPSIHNLHHRMLEETGTQQQQQAMHRVVMRCWWHVRQFPQSAVGCSSKASHPASPCLGQHSITGNALQAALGCLPLACTGSAQGGLCILCVMLTSLWWVSKNMSGLLGSGAPTHVTSQAGCTTGRDGPLPSKSGICLPAPQQPCQCTMQVAQSPFWNSLHVLVAGKSYPLMHRRSFCAAPLCYKPSSKQVLSVTLHTS